LSCPGGIRAARRNPERKRRIPNNARLSKYVIFSVGFWLMLNALG
jgi:hypothetical protein